MIERCNTCKFFNIEQMNSLAPSASFAPVVNGWCHRFPPQSNFNTNNATPPAVFPAVDQNDWCGEHLES